MNHSQLVKEQLVHMLFGTVIFVVLALTAVSLDLLSGWIAHLGVSSFTSQAIQITADVLLVVDLVLFSIYLAVSGYRLIKEMIQ
jgi:hypothetical protein